VVVLEERNQRSRDRHELFRRNVDVLDIFAQRENELARFSRGVTLVDDGAVFIELDVGLTNDVFVLFPRSEIERPRLVFSSPRICAELLVALLDLFERHVIARFELRVAAVDDANVLDDAAINYLAVRRFDKAKLVDARKARETRDESDVRTFRRLDRTDTSVVSWVYVADFESRALTRQTTRSEGRETAFVRDFRQRIRLVHELRQLARAEELAHRGRDRLGVDQVARHRRLHFLVNRHLLLDRTFHALEADAKLVFQQLTNRTDAPITEVIDVVRLVFRRVLTHLQHVSNDFVEVV